VFELTVIRFHGFKSMFFNKLNFHGALAAVASLALVSCGSAQDTAAAKASAAIPVAVFQAQFDDNYDQKQSLTGRLEAGRISATGFELPGKLAEVLVDDGDQVAAGQAIAKLDTQRMRANRAEIAALTDQAQVQLNLATTTLERMREALEFRGVSQQEYDEALNQTESARAQLAANRSRLLSIDVDLDKSTLTAPFDALITRRHIDEGQVVQAGQAVLTLQEKGALSVRIGVAGQALDALTPGSTHTLKIRDASIDAIVRQQLPQRDDVSRTVDVLLDVPDVTPDLRAGDLARLELRRRVSERGVWLPLEALAEGQRGLWTVYVAVPSRQADIGATHKVEPRPVEIIYQDTDRVFVRGTLEPGDEIIRAGLQRVVPGQFVRLSSESAT
jgi:RND family efflux transporter MFP subunit